MSGQNLFLFNHRWHGSTGLHSEQLRQPFCTILHLRNKSNNVWRICMVNHIVRDCLFHKQSTEAFRSKQFCYGLQITMCEPKRRKYFLGSIISYLVIFILLINVVCQQFHTYTFQATPQGENFRQEQRKLHHLHLIYLGGNMQIT